jgi:beta-mannosidase
VCDFNFPVDAAKEYHAYLELVDGKGQMAARNVYADVFHPPKHPEGHPQRMEHELGMRLYWA